MGPVQNQNSYNPDNRGVRNVDLKRIDKRQEIKDKSYSIVSGIFATVAAGLLTAYYNPTIAPLLFSLVGSTGAMVATALGVGGFGGLVGLATYYTISKTNRVSKEVFKNIQDSEKDHVLDTEELKNTIRVLEYNKKDRDLKRLFDAMSPKQMHGLSVDPDSKKYESYLARTENFDKLTSFPLPYLLKNDPYYRALYFERSVEEQKRIQEDVFKLDFPNVVASMSEVQDLDTRKVTVTDRNRNIRVIERRYIAGFLSSEDNKRLDDKNVLEVKNLDEIQKLLNILERKGTIRTSIDLENVLELAERFNLVELIKDISLLIQNRKDLVPDEKLAGFIEAHPMIARLRGTS